MKTYNTMMPPIPIEATLTEIIELLTPDIVGVKFELYSEHPIPRLTIDFMRDVLWSCTFVLFNNALHLQSFRMDASDYKKPNERDIEMTLDILRKIEGELNV